VAALKDPYRCVRISLPEYDLSKPPGPPWLIEMTAPVHAIVREVGQGPLGAEWTRGSSPEASLGPFPAIPGRLLSRPAPERGPADPQGARTVHFGWPLYPVAA